MCHNKYLVKDILKDKWGFEGVYLTDWAGCHDTDEAIHNGLDLEMGTYKAYNEYYLADPFLERAKQSAEVRQLLDDKVRRILRLMLSINKLSENRKQGEFNTKEHQKTAYDIAAEAMVLIKNSNNVLPLKKEKHKKILVVGPNATAKHAEGGNSSGVRTVYEITPLEGIKNRFGDICDIEYEKGTLENTHHHIPTNCLNIVEAKAGVRAVKQVSYKRCKDGTLEEEINYCNNTDLAVPGAESYNLYFSVNAPESGEISIKIRSSVGYTLKINGEICLDQEFYWSLHIKEKEFTLNALKGENIDFEINIDCRGNEAVFDFGWLLQSENVTSTGNTLMQKAALADYVIYCGGIDHSIDTEGFDKYNMKLPLEQNTLIEELAKINPNTVAVITAGSPVEMPWLDKINSVVWTWYAGMEVGSALADILAGDIVPSGKMPFTIPKKYEDCPVARYGEYKTGDCKYNEDILVGYRGFDYDGIEPLVPFGHGISYSDFEYSQLKITVLNDGVQISFKLKNIGDFIAKETAQVYIGDSVCSVKRPPKELKAFKKVELVPGETKEITLNINLTALSFYDETINDWKLENGEFMVLVGSSSRDIRLRERFEISL